MYDYSFLIPDYETDTDWEYMHQLSKIASRRIRSYKRKLGRKLTNQELSQVWANVEQEINAAIGINRLPGRYLARMNARNALDLSEILF